MVIAGEKSLFFRLLLGGLGRNMHVRAITDGCTVVKAKLKCLIHWLEAQGNRGPAAVCGQLSPLGQEPALPCTSPLGADTTVAKCRLRSPCWAEWGSREALTVGGGRPRGRRALGRGIQPQLRPLSIVPTMRADRCHHESQDL